MNRMVNPFLATLRLPVKLSPVIVIVGVSVHIISIFIPWYTGLGLGIKAILTFIPIASICFYLYKYNIKQRTVELILNAEENWQVKMDNGVVHQAVLGDSLFVHPLLTIFSLNYNKHRQYFILTPEIIDAEQFRRLRVRFRFHIDSTE